MTDMMKLSLLAILQMHLKFPHSEWETLFVWFSEQTDKKYYGIGRECYLQLMLPWLQLGVICGDRWYSLLGQCVRTRDEIVYHLPSRWHCVLIWRLVHMCRICEYL